MREANITPDFGFDADEPIVKGQQRNPWEYMSNIILPVDRQRNLWRCIREMRQIKKDYTKILQNKQKTLPKVLRGREEWKSLYKSFRIRRKDGKNEDFEDGDEGDFKEAAEYDTINDDQNSVQ
jgi:hypothetical protein